MNLTLKLVNILTRVRSGLLCKVTIQIKVLEKLPTQVFFWRKEKGLNFKWLRYINLEASRYHTVQS